MAQEDSWTTAMIEKWLVSRLAALTGTELRSIDVGERFSRYGLDSLGANRLLAELGAELGRQLPATLIWGSPTIRSLAEAVSVGAQPAARQVSSPAAASRTDDPVAVVGMSCRFPQADGLDAYWSLLSNGVDAVSDVPKGRWDTDALYDQDPSAPGRSAAAGWFPRPHRWIRSAVLWHLAARGGRDGPAAATVPGTRLGST